VISKIFLVSTYSIERPTGTPSAVISVSMNLIIIDHAGRETPGRFQAFVTDIID
jgi:hypothetical protein